MKAHTCGRREFLRRSGLTIAGVALGASAVPAQNDAPDFSFVAINDTHWKDEKCAAYQSAAFSWIRDNAACDFALVSGDLATAGALHELQGMKEAFDLLGKPVYPVMGNHDWSEGKRTWIEVFGEDRFNYRFDHKGWTFLGLDTTDQTKSEDVAVSDETVNWIRNALRDIPNARPIAAFTHFPFGENVPMRLTNADEALGLFAEHNLKHFFSGHFHGLTERTHGDVGLTTDKCMSFSRGNHDGTPEKGFFQVGVRGQDLSYEFVEFAYEG